MSWELVKLFSPLLQHHNTKVNGLYQQFARNFQDLHGKMKYLDGLSLRQIHQYIKSDNLLVDDKSYPVIIDFGISLSNFKTSLTDKQIFTQVYADPELVSNKEKKGKISRKNDVYSFGVTLYELFTFMYNILYYYNLPIYGRVLNSSQYRLIKRIQNLQKYLKFKI